MRGAATDVLTPTGAVISVTSAVDDAEQRIVTLGVTELYAVSADGELAGIVPDFELLKRRLAGDRRAQCVGDLMSPVRVSVNCATPLADVAVHMRSGCHRRIPVVANGRLVGEVTRRTLLQYFRTSDAVDVCSAESDANDDQRPCSAVAGPPKFLQAGRAQAAAESSDA